MDNSIIYALCDARDQICEICNYVIQSYQQYMDEEQIETLENIRMSTYCNLMNCKKPLTNKELEYFDTEFVKQCVAEELFYLIKLLNKLK